MPSTRGPGCPPFADRTWPELAALRERTDVALIPVGQHVQHGPHLPVAADVDQASAVCRLAARELEARGRPVLVGPPVPYGHSPAQEAFPGFVTLRPQTLMDLIVDLASSVARQGFRRLVLVVFGPASWPAVQSAIAELRRAGTAEPYALGGLELARALAEDVLEGHAPDEGRLDLHAGELETSLMLAIDASRVRAGEARTAYSPELAELRRLPLGDVSLLQRMLAVGLSDWSRFGAEGVSGAAALGSAAKGERLLGRLATAVADHVVRYVFAEAER